MVLDTKPRKFTLDMYTILANCAELVVRGAWWRQGRLVLSASRAACMPPLKAVWAPFAACSSPSSAATPAPSSPELEWESHETMPQPLKVGRGCQPSGSGLRGQHASKGELVAHAPQPLRPHTASCAAETGGVL